MRRFTSIGFSCTSRPHTETLPALGGMKPVIMRIVVDLPAPLGPRNPSTSPFPTSKETPSTARFGPKDLLRFSTLLIAPLQNIYTDPHGLSEVPCATGGTGFYRNLHPDIRQSPLTSSARFQPAGRKPTH